MRWLVIKSIAFTEVQQRPSRLVSSLVLSAVQRDRRGIERRPSPGTGEANRLAMSHAVSAVRHFSGNRASLSTNVSGCLAAFLSGLVSRIVVVVRPHGRRSLGLTRISGTGPRATSREAIRPTCRRRDVIAFTRTPATTDV